MYDKIHYNIKNKKLKKNQSGRKKNKIILRNNIIYVYVCMYVCIYKYIKKSQTVGQNAGRAVSTTFSYPRTLFTLVPESTFS